MANYRRTATGNWSTLAQWQDDSSGSYVASTVLPGAMDVVYANNFTVTLDIDVTVLELRTTTATNVNAGGLFDFGAGCNTVTANVFAGTTTCLRHNLTTIKNLIGNVTGGVSASAYGVQNSSTGTLNVIGNSISGSGTASVAIFNTAGGIINLTGNLTGGSGSFAYGGQNAAGGTINLTGNAIGGTIASAEGLINSAAGTINIIGSAIATSAPGATNSSNGQLFVTTAIASSSSSALNGNVVGGTTIVQNIVNDATGRVAISGFVKFSNAGPNTLAGPRQNGTTQTLVDASVGNPAVTDVRSGVNYASGALTGTCAVPPTGAVSLGVPVDNTTGTALFSPQDLFTAIANSNDPIAERLRNVSTVATTAATVAAFDV
jgi:hypothetical protein